MPTLLAIFAHPDDEVFGSGGMLARYAAEGVQVELVCATRGESGRITDPELTDTTDLAALRERELQAACRALGIQPPTFLNFHDSGRKERTRHKDPLALRNVDEDELESALLPQLTRVRPDIVLTFDPHGIYGHIDHIKIHRAATAAFWSVGGLLDDPPRRLFYSAMSVERFKAMQVERPTSPLSQLQAERYGVSESSLAAVIDIRSFADKKRAAINAHRSQVGPNSSFAGIEDGAQPVWDELFKHETFTLGGLRGGFPAAPVNDLFAGM